ncbi:transposon TX1 uncharacterized 149 kDa protein [Elysia marginata]|uniref:Transposon TX1 uncharacterized 149 kDa protein n=1 Tax=Elysia marginata TaxID=1093978 RepID=A0AAV4J143_9GAST|nr:transposon TX1 uncharacterized 149 kDa protein [Elysia marginata]
MYYLTTKTESDAEQLVGRSGKDNPAVRRYRFYEALKTVYGPTHQIQSPLRSSDGQQLLTEKPDILTRWAEHFNTLFSTDRSIQDAALHRIPHLPLIEELDDPPTLEETITAIGQLKSHNAAGIDGIPPEIWKNGGIVLHGKLHEVLVCCWEQGNLPQNLRDTVVITLYKNKGENQTAPITGYACNYSRMDDHRLPKIVMYSERSSGYRERGAPRKSAVVVVGGGAKAAATAAAAVVGLVAVICRRSSGGGTSINSSRLK